VLLHAYGLAFRAGALAQAGLVVGEDDVEHTFSLDRERPLARPSPRAPRGDVSARLEAAAVATLGARLHADDRRGVWQTQLPGKTARAVKPVDIADDAHAALLDAAVALVVLDIDLNPRSADFAKPFGRPRP
jgi:hypothetical protein